jgi:CheY-like chemotaxis protein
MEAEDGLAALSVIRQLNGKVSLLISDVQMPNLDSASLCRQVKETFPSIPVLLISGYATADECHAGDAFLQKPIQFDHLSQTISDLCVTNWESDRTASEDLQSAIGEIVCS